MRLIQRTETFSPYEFKALLRTTETSTLRNLLQGLASLLHDSIPLSFCTDGLRIQSLFGTINLGILMHLKAEKFDQYKLAPEYVKSGKPVEVTLNGTMLSGLLKSLDANDIVTLGNTTNELFVILRTYNSGRSHCLLTMPTMNVDGVTFSYLDPKLYDVLVSLSANELKANISNMKSITTDITFTLTYEDGQLMLNICGTSDDPSYGRNPISYHLGVASRPNAFTSNNKKNDREKLDSMHAGIQGLGLLNNDHGKIQHMEECEVDEIDIYNDPEKSQAGGAKEKTPLGGGGLYETFAGRSQTVQPLFDHPFVLWPNVVGGL
jgi:hypothetical protein